MATLNRSLVVQQGASFEFRVQVLGGPVSIAGYTAEMHIRPFRSSEEVYVELATPDAGLSIDAPSRTITISLTDEETAALDWIHPAVYDLELTGDNKTWRVMEGTATLSKEVTR